MKKILITGSTGFLGSYLVKKLRKTYRIDCLGYNTKSQHNADLTKKNQIKRILLKIKPNIIINLVANTNVDKCEKNKKSCYKVNFQTVKNLTNYSKKFEFKIIHISTDQLYDKNQYNKEDEIKIRNYYAKTKYMSEDLVLQSGGCVLRTNFFGYNVVKNQGLVNWILSSHINNDKIKIYKNIYFSPLFIKTLVKYIEIVCKNFKPGVYNLGSKDKINKSNFIKKIIKKFKLNIKYREIKYNHSRTKLKARRPLYMQMNVKKFEKEFNVKLPSINKEISKLKLSDKF